ncbi:MAG: hypothetical protein GY841_07760 [FCB group bacterium]|nr:hypothetical protein [FCB group bacterium]
MDDIKVNQKITISIKETTLELSGAEARELTNKLKLELNEIPTYIPYYPTYPTYPQADIWYGGYTNLSYISSIDSPPHFTKSVDENFWELT